MVLNRRPGSLRVLRTVSSALLSALGTRPACRCLLIFLWPDQSAIFTKRHSGTKQPLWIMCWHPTPRVKGDNGHFNLAESHNE